jgi:hypothetical protein
MRTRLWQAAGALVLLLATFAVANFVIPRDRAVTRDLIGHDFLAFYTAGTFARLGQFDSLYDLDAVRAFQRETAQRYGLTFSGDVAPFWNPPFCAWPLAPLSMLPYGSALNVWLGVNLAALAGAIVLLIRMLPGERDWRTWALVPLLACTSMPFIQAMTHGQNTCVSLLLLCAVVTAWRRQRDALAGVLCALMFYKPQLAAVLAVMLVLDRGPRALLWMSCTLGAIFFLAAVTMPGAIGDYARLVPANIRAIQFDRTYLWERHVTLLAMWRLLVQGRAPGETALIVTALTWLTCAAVAGGLLWAAMRARRVSADDVFTGDTKFIRRDRLIAATVASTPLIMPFHFDYDLLLLSAAAVLFAGEAMMRAPGAPPQRNDRATLFAWVALFGWTMINPLAAAVSGINVTVAVLGVLAPLLTARAGRHVDSAGFVIRRPQAIPVSARRAA